MESLKLRTYRENFMQLEYFISKAVLSWGKYSGSHSFQSDGQEIGNLIENVERVVKESNPQKFCV